MNHLKDKRILLTRTKEQNENTAQQLKALGAIPVYLPCLQIDYLKENIQKALKKIQADKPSNTDIIFSSSNGVKAVA
ncbi:MAG: hypothetical protein L3J61_04490, partial [Ghiorsea sp.]|nr:hypothetical protein [Ghiorsea sp.]